jgi:hypothetical protein
VNTPLLLGSSTGNATLGGANLIDALGANPASPFDASGNAFCAELDKAASGERGDCRNGRADRSRRRYSRRPDGTTSVVLTAGSAGLAEAAW